MSKRVILGIIGAIVLLIGWWGFQHRGSPDQSPSTRSSGRRGAGPGGPVPVVAGKVEQKDMPIYLDGLGTVQAFNTVAVHTRVDGQLQQVLFSEGQDVKTGDLLAIVDPRPYQAALDQAIAKKSQDEAQLANAKVTLARNTDLMNKKVIAQSDFDTSKYSVDQFQSAVQADQAAIESARTNLDYTQIKSPIVGIVKKNAIMMVDFALDAERNEGLSPEESIYQACLVRFRPIMMTTLAAMFGALPLAIGMGIGSELRRPLGIAIVGGLIVSQILTLYTTPVIYLALDQLRQRKHRRASSAVDLRPIGWPPLSGSPAK